MSVRSERCVRGAAAGALLLALCLAPAARAEGPSGFSPMGVYRYTGQTAYELGWTYGGAAFAPAGAGLSAGGLHFRETNGPAATILVTVLAAVGGAAAGSSSTKDAYAAGQISREEAIRRIDARDAEAQRLLTNAPSEAVFDADLTVYSDKFGGQTAGLDAGLWIGKHLFPIGPTLLEFEWGLKGARIWGSTLSLPGAPDVFDHAHLGGMLQVRVDVTRYAELDLRFDPNLLRIAGAPSHESPLTLGAVVNPVEFLYLGGQAVFTGLEGPRALLFSAGVRL